MTTERSCPDWAKHNDMPWTPGDVAAEVAAAAGIRHEGWMQDWPLEAAGEACLERVIVLVEKEKRDEHLAALLTVLICRLDTAFAQGEYVDAGLQRRLAQAIERYPEVMLYWTEADASFTITPWLRQIQANLSNTSGSASA